jgi:hypothetical protein
MVRRRGRVGHAGCDERWLGGVKAQVPGVEPLPARGRGCRLRRHLDRDSAVLDNRERQKGDLRGTLQPWSECGVLQRRVGIVDRRKQADQIELQPFGVARSGFRPQGHAGGEGRSAMLVRLRPRLPRRPGVVPRLESRVSRRNNVLWVRNGPARCLGSHHQPAEEPMLVAQLRGRGGARVVVSWCVHVSSPLLSLDLAAPCGIIGQEA